MKNNDYLVTESEGSVWYSFLDTIMKIPGVKVNRQVFLTGQFSKYFDEGEIGFILKNGTVKAGVSPKIMDKVAEDVISFHATTVIGTSFLAGLPGGFAMLGTIPADVAQYYYHTFQVAQKLAYVYGYPDLDNGTSDDFNFALTIFMGVMFGVAAANTAIKTLSRTIAITAVKKLSKMALTKTTIYPIVKQIAKVLGIRMTKEIFSKSVGKIIPVLGGIISAGITAAVFIPQANRLKNKFSEDINMMRRCA